MKPYYFLRPDICPNCGEQSLELYNRYDDSMRLTDAIENKEEDILQKLNARYFRCTRCGADYPINWVFGKPIPLTNSTFDIFFSQFKSCKTIN